MKEYKILLVCSGGMSTSILVTKMEAYAKEHDIDLKIEACGTDRYADLAKDYEVLLVGPQIAYRKGAIAADVSIPVASMQPQDYAMCRCANIFKQVDSLLA